MKLHERQSIAEEIALRLLIQTYDDLAQLADDEDRADAFLKQSGVNIQCAPYVSLMIGQAGCLRKKMCVEITVVEDSANSQEPPGCIYFEKFSTGKLVVYGFKR